MIVVMVVVDGCTIVVLFSVSQRLFRVMGENNFIKNASPNQDLIFNEKQL
jgi:hypothetical protein